MESEMLTTAKELSALSAGLSTPALLGLLFLLWKLGVLNPSPKREGGNTPDSSEKQSDGLKEDIKQVRTEVREIKDNHLPHIYEKIGKIANDVAYMRGKMSK